jgi:hypothetical protein
MDFVVLVHSFQLIPHIEVTMKETFKELESNIPKGICHDSEIIGAKDPMLAIPRNICPILPMLRNK